ncbi:glycosyltransferase family 2 protein [Rugamonas rubra]|uniref:Glycosyltransferase, GT2 family n=1 Tax=Rugamonas rubra TaxID=758825 RepID=A0A1I4N0G3_9BURK|nr:glycosyltransferase [Rugamonas rubra]SFM09011.1 Glycosyltransferase, GT2 family [Rugamonas rubra]
MLDSGAAADRRWPACCAPRRRDDALLAEATLAFERGAHADALLAAEAACRRHRADPVPALLRAAVLQAAGSPLADEAWYRAWCRAPEDARLQDALMQAWLARGAGAKVAELGPALLPARCRDGSHAPLLRRMRAAGADPAGACWKVGGAIEGMLFAPAGAVRLLLDDSRSGARYEVRLAQGGRFRLAPPRADGVWSLALAGARGRRALAGAPLSFTEQLPRALPPGAPPAAAGPAPLTVLIPVYRGLAATQACVASVLASLAHNRARAGVLVVDDCSPEPALSAWLEQLAGQGRIALLRNRANLGFIESVNRGLRQRPLDDALLLNADTLVQGDWLDRLQASLYSGADVASVSPWSNNGEISSFPAIGAAAPMPDAGQLRRLDEAAAGLHRSGALGDVEVPACCGFAMLMRRGAIERIGVLDGAALHRGYGEELDWCQRARAAGYRHLAATGVFVAHAGGLSFGLEKPLRVRQNRAVVAARHPHCYAEYQRFLRDDPLAAARGALALALRRNGAAPAAPAAPGDESSAAPAAAAPAAGALRIAVWQHRAGGTAARKILALARLLAARGGAAPAPRLLVFGEASEALWHTGVVDVLPRDTRREAALLDDSALLRLAGCAVLLNPGHEAAPAGIRQVPVDDDFDPAGWLAAWLAGQPRQRAPAPTPRAEPATAP